MATVYKLVMVGGGGVGKSAITVRFINDEFVEVYDPTIEDSYQKDWLRPDGVKCVMDILDTAGQEEFTVIRDRQFMERQGFVLVYAVDSRKSFDDLKRFYDRIVRVKDERNVPIIVVGNKKDLEGRQVTTAEGQKLANELGVSFIESSAKTGENINNIFRELVKCVDVKAKSLPSAPKRGGCSCSVV